MAEQYQPFYTGSYALIIGINTYSDPRFPPLGEAEADAQAIAGVLRSPPHNFEVTMLLGEQATRRAILKALFELRSTQPDDRILVCFTGHGYTLTDRFGAETGYLAAVDTIPDQDYTALELGEVTSLCGSALAKHIGFIFDACMSGAALGLTRSPGMADESILVRRAYQVLSAGAGDSLVSDYLSMTGLIAEALQADPSEIDGMFTFSDLGMQLQQRRSTDTKYLQVPQFGHLQGSQGGDMVFFVKEGSDVTVTSPPAKVAFTAKDVNVLIQDNQTLTASPDEITPTRLIEQASRTPHAINDLPGGEDALGFSDYAEAFAELVTNDKVSPPLTIGIYGAWGMGKTFLMGEITTAIEKAADRLNKTRRPRNRVRMIPIPFNAWSYNASDILWAGLIEQVFEYIEEELGWYGKLRVTMIRNWVKERKKLSSQLLYLVLLSIVVGLILIWTLQQFDQAALAAVVPFLASWPILFKLIREFVKIAGTQQSQQIAAMLSSETYDKERGLMARIHEDMEALVGALPDHVRLIVFIDDLDRCKPERAIEVLEAINLLLDFNVFIVFLAVDTRIVANVIEAAYEESLERAGVTGYEYLDKIVQIPFSIPKARPTELREYLDVLVDAPEGETDKLVFEELLSQLETLDEDANIQTEPEEPIVEDGDIPAERPVREPEPAAQEPTEAAKPDQPTIDTEYQEVPFTLDERRTFRGLEDYLDPNPRRVKRLVNIYRLVRTLAYQKNLPIIEEEPEKVILWLMLCQQWPYAMTCMLDVFRQSHDDVNCLTHLHKYASVILEDEKKSQLSKLDYDYRVLHDLVASCGAFLTCDDIRAIQPLTINFHPALTPEVLSSIQ